jgi:hypothetical protein
MDSEFEDRERQERWETGLLSFIGAGLSVLGWICRLRSARIDSAWFARVFHVVR